MGVTVSYAELGKLHMWLGQYQKILRATGKAYDLCKADAIQAVLDALGSELDSSDD